MKNTDKITKQDSELFRKVIGTVDTIEHDRVLHDKPKPSPKPYKNYIDGSGFSPFIAFLLSWLICWQFDIDVLANLSEGPKNDEWGWLGPFITAAVVAGGSKGALKLMQDVLKIAPQAPLAGGNKESTLVAKF